ncbi:MAG: polA [Haloplasmataceae bacterium]|jgi:DNA polymerase-1|nr:polA [Haloplasmataceae bacterium]
MNKVIIIDGHNLLFRMFYGIPNSFKNSRGEEIKGAFGFLASIKKLVDYFSTDKLIVVFDSETSIGSRIEIDHDYKQNRMDYSNLPEAENPFYQLKHIYKTLDYLNIHYVEAQNVEADDYIASLSERLKAKYEVVIVSTDKDFLQLVDLNVSVYNAMSDIYYTPEKVFEKFEVSPKQIIDYKILVGDKSDNIKGVPSIGMKTAVKILQIGSLEEIYKKEKALDTKLYNKIIDHWSIVDKNRSLITMNKNIEITLEETILVLDSKFNKKTRDILVECGVY